MKTVRVGRFQFQKKTKEEWLNSKVTLYDGELAIESDTSMIKIGDGKSSYLDLPYIKIGEFGLKDLTEEERASLKGEPFKYEDFSEEQLQALKGEKGEKGEVDWSNITEEQKQTLIEVLDIPDVDLTPYAKTTDLENYQPKGNYLTATDIASLASKTELNNYVEKVDGKVLSTNDFTNAHKTKVDNIPDGFEYKESIDESFVYNAISIENAFSKEADLYKYLNARTGLEFTPSIQTLDDLVNSETAMVAIASSEVGMKDIAASQTAMSAVINSSTAMNAVINSSTAMSAVANSSTAMSVVAASSTAMSAVANSSTAMNAVKSNVDKWTNGLSKQSGTFKPSDVKKLEKIPGTGIYVITKVWDQGTMKDSCTLYSGPNKNIQESYTATNTSTSTKGFVAVHSLWMETTSSNNEMNINYDLYIGR